MQLVGREEERHLVLADPHPLPRHVAQRGAPWHGEPLLVVGVGEHDDLARVDAVQPLQLARFEIGQTDDGLRMVLREVGVLEREELEVAGKEPARLGGHTDAPDAKSPRMGEERTVDALYPIHVAGRALGAEGDGHVRL